MSDRSRLAIGVAAVALPLLAFAFIAAPKSCEWGLDAYFVAGVAASIALFAWPLHVLKGRSLALRIGLGALFVLLACVIWLGGLFAANFQIMCRLF